jgi:hypothetical protein
MLLSIVLAAQLFAIIPNAQTQEPPAPELGDLPIVIPPEKLLQFPSPGVPSPPQQESFSSPPFNGGAAQSRTLAGNPESPQALRTRQLRTTLAALNSPKKKPKVHFTLNSGRHITGHIAQLDDDTFTLRTSPSSPPSIIRYSEVRNFRQDRPGQTGAYILLGIGVVLLAIPAVPFLILAMSIGAIAE